MWGCYAPAAPCALRWRSKLQLQAYVQAMHGGMPRRAMQLYLMVCIVLEAPQHDVFPNRGPDLDRGIYNFICYYLACRRGSCSSWWPR